MTLDFSPQIIHRLIQHNNNVNNRRKMHKENFAILNKQRRTLSLQRMKKLQNEKIVAPSIRTIKLLENNITRTVNSSPIKQKNPPQNGDQKVLPSPSNGKMLPIGHHKQSIRLRLSREDSENNQEPSQNTATTQDFAHQLRQLITKDLLKDLTDRQIIIKSQIGHLIIKQQIFSGLIEKITSLFITKNQRQSPPSLSFLDITLSRIHRIIIHHNQKQKRLKNKIGKTIQVIRIASDFNEEIKEAKGSLLRLNCEKNSLLEEIERLQAMKAEINEQCNKKRKEIQESKEAINGFAKRIEGLAVEQQKRENQVEKITCLRNTCEKEYENILNYVQIQTKNKLVKMASENYKNIESQIYEYAVYLQSNELATSYTYESIPFQNQKFILTNIEHSLREVNRELISTTLPLQQKSRLMRDFVLRFYEQHKRKDQQLQKLLEFKTRSIRKFVDMMQKWLDNWTLKQEYLVGLRKEFAIDTNNLCQRLHEFFYKRLCSCCFEGNKSLYEQVVAIFRKIEENYKMGNSFY